MEFQFHVNITSIIGLCSDVKRRAALSNSTNLEYVYYRTLELLSMVYTTILSSIGAVIFRTVEFNRLWYQRDSGLSKLSDNEKTKANSELNVLLYLTRAV